MEAYDIDEKNTHESPDKWEIESAASTLIEAEEIQKDPKMGPLALAEVKRRMECAQKVLSEADVESRAKKNLKKVYGD